MKCRNRSEWGLTLKLRNGVFDGSFHTDETDNLVIQMNSKFTPKVCFKRKSQHDGIAHFMNHVKN